MDAVSVADGGIGPQTTKFSTFKAMCGVRRWLVWKKVPQPDKKPLKVPYYVNGATRGSTDTPEDWAQLASYDDAKAALALRGEDWGLAFALGPDGTGWHWQGIDLDQIEVKELGRLANRWIREDLHDWGHVELSPSGTGQHVIGYGRLFTALGSNITGIEAYSSGRFFTVTEREVRADSPGRLIDLAEYVERELAPLHGAGRSAPSGGNTVEVVRVSARTVSELRSALMHMRSDDYELWIRMGLGLRELDNIGRELWLTWSATSEKFDPKIAAKKWDTFNPTSTGYQAVFAQAQLTGWVNPASSVAQLTATDTSQRSTENPVQMIARLMVDLSDRDEDDEVPDIVEGLVADEEVTLLGGHGGVGKSFLALQLACSIALGKPLLGCVTRQSRLLYYSAEDGRKRLKRRLRNVIDTFNFDPLGLRDNLLLLDASDVDPLYGEELKDLGSAGKPHLMKRLGDTATFRNLQSMVEAFDPQLVIVDGASDTFDGNEIARREVRAFIKLLRQVHPSRKIGVLLMVHIDRASARGYSSNDDGYAGNAQWHNSCRRRIYLQQKVERDEDDGSVISETFLLRVMKNQDGKPVPDMELIRGEFGLWHPAVEYSGLHRQSPEPENHAATLAQLVKEAYDRGQYISASMAPNASTGLHATLSSAPGWPRRLRKAKQTNEVLREMERNGILAKEPYQRPNRTWAERWKVVREPGQPFG